jgi:type III secretory pathway component EscS
MKLILAKIIYYTGIVSLIGVAIGMFAALGWFIVTTIPFFLAILAGFAVLIVFGLAMGWAETQMDRAKGYKK